MDEYKRLKIGIYCLFIISLLILSGCSEQSSNLSTSSNLDIGTCRNITTTDNQDNLGVNDKIECYVNYGMNNGADACDENEKEICKIGIAAKNKDTDYCLNYDPQCYLIFGLAVKDNKICQSIVDNYGKKLCLFGVATSLKDKGSCDRLVEENNPEMEYLQQQCYLTIASKSKDTELCDNLNDIYNSSCYYNIAVSTLNVELCEKAGDKKYQCYSNIAEITINKSLCEKSDSFKQSCYEKILEKQNELRYQKAVNSNDLEACKQIINNTGRVNRCIIEIAINLKDITICNQFSNSDKEQCLYALAIPTLNENLCEYGNEYENCITSIAIGKKDNKLCELLEDVLIEVPKCQWNVMSKISLEPLNYTRCYQSEQLNLNNAFCIEYTSLANNESKGCDMIPDNSRTGYARYDCFEKLAMQTKNPIYCENADYPDECFDKFMTKDISICKNMSTAGSIRCYLNGICKIKNIKSDCYNILYSQSKEITRKAISVNDSSKCEELKESKVLCYAEFAKKLGFNLAEVLKYDISGQDEVICKKLKDKPQNKCYFNLAIEENNKNFCDLSGEFRTRCIENIQIKRDNPKNYQLWGAVKDRLYSERKNKNIHVEDYNIELIDNIEQANIVSEGETNLDGSELRIYMDQKLMDIDGCKIIYPRKYITEDCNISTCIYKLCSLEYDSYDPYSSTLETEYQNIIINTLTPK